MPAQETFRAWFSTHLAADYAHDIANNGADSGFPYITYTQDCVALFDRFGPEIWDMAVGVAADTGAKNILDMVAGFDRADMTDTLDDFKTLMVWFGCEELARELGEPS